MHRRPLLDMVATYERLWGGKVQDGRPYEEAEERQILRRITDFVTMTPDCCERTCLAGHMTGSALVVSPDLSKLLLTLHRKLGKWLQLGGHADGSPALHEVALREAEEESGLPPGGVCFLPYEASLGGTAALIPVPFDFDAHAIPARPGEPAHVHYDARYLLVADPATALRMSAESKDLRWFPLATAWEATTERSMHRQFAKLAWLKERLTGGGKALG